MASCGFAFLVDSDVEVRKKFSPASYWPLWTTVVSRKAGGIKSGGWPVNPSAQTGVRRLKFKPYFSGVKSSLTCRSGCI